MQLSYDIFKIDNLKMGRVLTIIEAACPSAINRKASEDEVLLNFDAMYAMMLLSLSSLLCCEVV